MRRFQVMVAAVAVAAAGVAAAPARQQGQTPRVIVYKSPT